MAALWRKMETQRPSTAGLLRKQWPIDALALVPGRILITVRCNIGKSLELKVKEQDRVHPMDVLHISHLQATAEFSDILSIRTTWRMNREPQHHVLANCLPDGSHHLPDGSHRLPASCERGYLAELSWNQSSATTTPVGQAIVCIWVCTHTYTQHTCAHMHSAGPLKPFASQGNWWHLRPGHQHGEHNAAFLFQGCLLSAQSS